MCAVCLLPVLSLQLLRYPKCVAKWWTPVVGVNVTVGLISSSTVVFLGSTPLIALSVIATATWLGGCQPDTLWYCIKTAKPIGKLFRPSEIPLGILYRRKGLRKLEWWYICRHVIHYYIYIIIITYIYIYTIILVFWDPCADTKFQAEPLQRGR